MQIHELHITIEGIAQGGDGVGRSDGMVVFARGGLPGEEVRVRLTERKSSYARGEVVEVITASPDRVQPVLATSNHAPWQHIAYEAQVRFKETILREQLAKLAGVDRAPLRPMLVAPHPWGYRNAATLHCDGSACGYYASGSRTVIDLPHDPLLLPALNEALVGLRKVVAESDAVIGSRLRLVREVSLRTSGAFGYSLGTLHPAPGADPAALQRLAHAWFDEVASLAGVCLDDAEFHRTHKAIVGVASLHDTLDEIVFSLSPTSFFQVNLPQAEQMLALVKQALEPAPGQHLLDLYSGVGTFALPLAAAGAKVTAIEDHWDAVTDGERSAALNGIGGVNFLRASVERALVRMEERFDGVVLDPPRRGCHPSVLTELIRLAPPCIVYISCHPGILGRDLMPLLRAGYQIQLLQPIDLFPQTPHIETLVVLQQAALPDPQ
ncbi:23S rRNA (uracil(1939)-C(5))-methyltransferase RlmD [Candidatus Chloroploca mongolica]|uniref:23S rRNA (uracil(1939)-C(5))-methyltransferase RlmD n=1 Tax=Candidatus Chloroploca mongolica TaxID=2528176 RepID=UPI001C20F242|nr:23S rRNA (uracil(1939)-C(5))-methyltransferase RlmD [Candidatus Chloroploca mongolica]